MSSNNKHCCKYCARQLLSSDMYCPFCGKRQDETDSTEIKKIAHKNKLNLHTIISIVVTVLLLSVLGVSVVILVLPLNKKDKEAFKDKEYTLYSEVKQDKKHKDNANDNTINEEQIYFKATGSIIYFKDNSIITTELKNIDNKHLLSENYSSTGIKAIDKLDQLRWVSNDESILYFIENYQEISDNNYTYTLYKIGTENLNRLSAIKIADNVQNHAILNGNRLIFWQDNKIYYYDNSSTFEVTSSSIVAGQLSSDENSIIYVQNNSNGKADLYYKALDKLSDISEPLIKDITNINDDGTFFYTDRLLTYIYVKKDADIYKLDIKGNLNKLLSNADCVLSTDNDVGTDRMYFIRKSNDEGSYELYYLSNGETRLLSSNFIPNLIEYSKVKLNDANAFTYSYTAVNKDYSYIIYPEYINNTYQLQIAINGNNVYKLPISVNLSDLNLEDKTLKLIYTARYSDSDKVYFHIKDDKALYTLNLTLIDRYSTAVSNSKKDRVEKFSVDASSDINQMIAVRDGIYYISDNSLYYNKNKLLSHNELKLKVLGYKNDSILYYYDEDRLGIAIRDSYIELPDSDHVKYLFFRPDGSVIFIKNYNEETQVGELMYFNGNHTVQIDSGVSLFGR